MNNWRNIAAAIILGVSATTVAAQEQVTADTVVATVNGTEIKLGHMILARENLPAQYQQLAPEQLFDGILQQIIQQTVLADLAKNSSAQRIEFALDNEKRLMQASSVVDQIMSEALTEDAIQSAYDQAYANFDGGQEFNASHILVATEEDASAIVADLRAGADFAETAREKSTGPSGPNGGQLGWFGPGMMVPPFEAAVEQLSKGEISDPVQTQFGWHVIILNDVRAMQAPTLEEVRSEIVADLEQATLEVRLSEIEASAEIWRQGAPEVDPALIMQSDLVD